jgi:hypothetical protein
MYKWKIDLEACPDVSGNADRRKVGCGSPSAKSYPKKTRELVLFVTSSNRIMLQKEEYYGRKSKFPNL